MYGYQISEAMAGMSGLRIVLGALAVKGKDEGQGVRDPEWREAGWLFLDLEWPDPRKVMGAGWETFEPWWRKEGVYDCLIGVERVRRIEIGGSAYESFGGRWV